MEMNIIWNVKNDDSNEAEEDMLFLIKEYCENKWQCNNGQAIQE